MKSIAEQLNEIGITDNKSLKRYLNRGLITPKQYALLRLLRKLEKRQDSEYNKKLVQDIKQKLKEI